MQNLTRPAAALRHVACRLGLVAALSLLGIGGVLLRPPPASAADSPLVSAPHVVEYARGMMPTSSPDYVPPKAGPPVAAVPGAFSARLATGGSIGLDVASYQHPGGAPINWPLVAATGRTFVVVKATEGAGSALYVNPYYASDVRAAAAVGLRTGAYHFARPGQPAIAQADAFAAVLGAAAPTAMAPVLDLEVTDGLNPLALQSWTRAFLAELQARTGRLPMIYSSPGFWASAMAGDPSFAAYPLWEAHYTDAAAPLPIGGWGTRWTLWQHTSTALVAGVSGLVDSDRSVGTLTPSAARGAWQAALVDLSAVLAQGGSGRVEVHQLSGSSNYRAFTAHIATALGSVDPAQWRFIVGPYRNDGAADLFAIRLVGGGSGKIEIHVLSAASNYQQWVLHLATAQRALTDSRVDIQMGAFRGDRNPDLYIIPWGATGSGQVEVHILSAASNYQTYLAHAASALPLTAVTAGAWSFLVGDGAGNGDVYAVCTSGRTGTGMTEMHVLSAVSGYRQWSLHTGTGLRLLPPGTVSLFLQDVAAPRIDGVADLVAVVHGAAAGGNLTQVHVLSGATRYQIFSVHAVSALGNWTGAGWQFSVG